MTTLRAAARIDQVNDLIAPAAGDLLVDAAVQAADAAALAAGVRVRELSRLDELHGVHQLYARIWRPEPASPSMTTDLLRALTKAGNYVSGAYLDGELVGACVAFFGPPRRASMHSHIAGVSDAARGRSVGYALKLHQRAWALLRGVAELSWTFDPLIRRNAYFNLVKLGASVVEYLPKFYGDMHDRINCGDDSDRLLVRWRLDAPPRGHTGADTATLRAGGAAVALAVAPDGGPAVYAGGGLAVAPDGGPARCAGGVDTLLVGVPEDVEALRARDPDCGRQWRRALREVFAGLLADGYRVSGFDRAGWYVLTKKELPS
jgi:predicted GNAT superfamily acetyltransferase